MRIVLQRATLAAVIAFATTASAFAQSAADLFITKTAPATANPGDNVTFTVTIGNVGPDPSTGVNMTDTLPPESTFVSEMQTGGPTTFVCTTPNVGDFGGSVSCVATADIAEAETETFQIVVNVPVAAAGATLINSASVSAETPDDDDENNSSIAATTISGGTLADVGIMKSGPASALPSSNVTFTITVTDFGPNDASTVTFDDVLGSGLTFVSLNQTGGPAFSCPGGMTPCTIATLPNGSPATFDLVATTSASPGTYTNSATVTSANDPNSENDAAIASVIVNSADLSVTKSGPATATSGQPILYSITVTNNGPDAAINAGFTDTLPAGTTFVSVVQNTGPLAPCSNNGTTVACKAPVLSNASSLTFTVTANVLPNVADGTVLTNTATTVQDGGDANPANNSSSTAATVSAQADLSITKSGPATATAGTTATYNVSVSNAGPSDAASVQWTDALPPNTTFVSEMQTSGPAFTCTTGATISCSAATFAAGATATFTFTVNVSSGATGSVSNTAVITSATSDTNPGNNSSTAIMSLTTSADVAVTKTGASAVAAGTNITYTINVTNNGPSDAAAVSLNDVIPATTTFVSMTQTSGPAFSCSGTSTQTCTIASLISGATASFSLVVQVSASATVGSMISNTANVTSTTPDSNSGNNSSTATSTVSASVSDLSITKTASPASPVYPVGTDVTFTLTASNAGPNDAASVTVTDALPPNMTFVSASSTQGTCSGTSTVTCSLGTLATGASATITIVADTASEGSATNTATISSATSSDPNPANNSASVTFLVSANIPTLSPLLLLLLATLLAAVALRLLTE